jgi:hypothetical protein
MGRKKEETRVLRCLEEGIKTEEGSAHTPRVVVAGEKKELASCVLPWEEVDKEGREIANRWDGILGAPLVKKKITSNSNIRDFSGSLQDIQRRISQ